jgi:hypothetical protein
MAAVCDPDRVIRVHRSEPLRAVRAQLAAAAAGLAELTGGPDDTAIDTARNRLRDAQLAVIHAAGGVSRWLQLGLALPVIGAGSWAAAAIGQRSGLSAGWPIVLASAVTIGLLALVAVLIMALDGWLGRRRTAPAAPTAVPVEVSTAAQVLARVRMARDGLRAAIRDRAAAHRPGDLAATSAGFDWLRVRDRRLRWMTLADRRLCLVGYAIEGWLLSGSGQR